jgi:hypothetical protein
MADRLDGNPKGGNISEQPPRPESVPLGIILVLVGAYIGVGHTLLSGQTHWMLPVVGVIVAAVGLSYIAPALGPGGKKLLDQLTVACVTLALNYAVFVTSLDWLRSIGGVWGLRLALIAVVAADVYLVFWIAKSLLRVQGYRLAGFIGSLLVAIGLHAAGVLERIRFSSPFLPPITSGALEVRRVNPKVAEFPLQDFTGTWVTPQRFRDAGWIVRIAVVFDGGTPWARLWRACATGECEAGTYRGVIESRSRGTAQAIHFAGRTDGTHWIASLRTEQGIYLHEQRLRGSDANLRQEQGGLAWRRVAP